MANAPRENFDYAAINQKINRKYDPNNFEDLRGLSLPAASYDKNQSPTENIKAFLAQNVYNGDGDKAYHHSFDVFHALHEQALARNYEGGFNSLAEQIRNQCAAIELKKGKIGFLKNDGTLIGEFDSASSERKDLEKRTFRYKEQVANFTKKSLREVLPALSGYRPRRIIDYGVPPVHFPPSFFRDNRQAPLLLDTSKASETICAAYVTEVERYYAGSRKIQEWGIEGLDAWELKRQLLYKKAARVDASMSGLLKSQGGGRPTLSFSVRLANGRMQRMYGDRAKEQPYYGAKYRTFYRSAEKTGNNVPPGLITLFFHGTQHAADIVRANREGANSPNSHVVVNLGEGKTEIPTGSFGSQDDTKSVMDVLRAHFPNMRPSFAWAFLDGKADARQEKSRVYLNGQQLQYHNGQFFTANRQEARVSSSDKVEWEDVMVMDRFHGQNRVVGLTELMMTGRYEIVDLLNFKEQQPAPEMPKTAVSVTNGLLYLKPGETLTAALAARGVTAREMPYHIYQYEKLGIRPSAIRPYDPVPAFDSSAIMAEVNSKGGLSKALAEMRTQRAAEYIKKHPGEYLLIIQPGQTPDAFAGVIFALPDFAQYGKLTGREKQFIVTAIMAAHRGIAVDIDEHGKIKAAMHWDAGTEILIAGDLLQAIKNHMESEREKSEVFIPPSLSGGPNFRPPKYSQEERIIIQNATHEPHVRTALALVLAMEQKQEKIEGLPIRGTKKTILDTASMLLDKMIVHQTMVQGPQSVGMFQVRVDNRDLANYRKKTGNPSATLKDLRRAAAKDEILNSNIAAERLERFFGVASRLYKYHGENFTPDTPGCMAFVLNCYHFSEAKVLKNTFDVWTHQLTMSLQRYPALKDKVPATGSAAQRLEKTARLLRDQGLITITEEDIAKIDPLIKNNKIAFLSSPVLKALEKWHFNATGEKLSLNVPLAVLDDPNIKTTALNYGNRATRYGTLDEIERYSINVRQSSTHMLASR